MKIKCPACSEILQVAESAAGNVVQCPCGKQLRVPSGTKTLAPSSSPATPSAGTPSAGGSDWDHGGTASGFDQLTEDDFASAQPSPNPYAAELPKRDSFDPLQGYAPPRGPGSQAGMMGVNYGVRASLGQRIGGAMIDAFLAFGLGGVFAMIGGGIGTVFDSGEGDIIVAVGYVAFYLGLFSVPVINAVLITMSGQSVGKKVAGTRIVDRESGVQAGFVQGVLLRNFVFAIITSIPCIGGIVALADLIMLFPEPNETLHDKIARTAVVQA